MGNEDEELVGTAQAAALTGLSEQSIRRLCGAGTIPARKVGRDWLIRRGDLRGVVKRKNTGRKPTRRQEPAS